ncbi:MAG: hypothetical protein GXP38_09910 [Chloroflexi bacterium]|nr:hypothetical protein [Chloroflexota bacterium]
MATATPYCWPQGFRLGEETFQVSETWKVFAPDATSPAQSTPPPHAWRTLPAICYNDLHRTALTPSHCLSIYRASRFTDL